MGRIKSYHKKQKYGIIWIYLDGTWFVDGGREAKESGIYTSVTTAQLDNPNYLHKISAVKSYWKKYIKK